MSDFNFYLNVLITTGFVFDSCEEFSFIILKVDMQHALKTYVFVTDFQSVGMVISHDSLQNALWFIQHTLLRYGYNI